MASNSAPKLPKLPKLSKHRSISQGMSKEKAQLRFKDDKLASQMLVVMNESRLSDRYCDIKLLIRENEDAEPITAHKLVLISFSCYFEGLLSSNMKEGSQDEIRIHNLHAPSVQNLVEFTYTGSILITSDNIEVLLEAANFLAVDSVCQACCKFLEENMNPENCVGIMGCADVYGFMTLHEKAFRFARDNFFQVAQSDEIENLPFENLKQLISSERLYEGGQIIPMPSVQEKVVLKVVCKFIHANNLVGSKESLELFKQVRMSLLEQEDVDSLFQSNVTKNNTDLEALIQERRSREAGSVLDTAIPYWCRPRKYPGWCAMVLSYIIVMDVPYVFNRNKDGCKYRFKCLNNILCLCLFFMHTVVHMVKLKYYLLLLLNMVKMVYKKRFYS